MRASRRAATPIRRCDHGVASSIQIFQARRAPSFAVGSCATPQAPGFVPWWQPGGWGMKSLTASTAPFRPEPDRPNLLAMTRSEPVHILEQRYVFWWGTFCHNDMEDRPMVYCIESILDIEVHNNRYAVLRRCCLARMLCSFPSRRFVLLWRQNPSCVSSMSP